jgi:SagB-type dehydrogenase family enzyme
MDLYLAAGNGTRSIDAGLYHYQPTGHRLDQIVYGDLRREIAAAALSQAWLARAPLSLIITAEYGRAAGKYGKRAIRYAMIEAGHIGQNIFLQAEALGMKAGIIGAFHDNELVRALRIPRSHKPLLIMPVGYV